MIIDQAEIERLFGGNIVNGVMKPGEYDCVVDGKTDYALLAYYRNRLSMSHECAVEATAASHHVCCDHLIEKIRAAGTVVITREDFDVVNDKVKKRYMDLFTGAKTFFDVEAEVRRYINNFGRSIHPRKAELTDEKLAEIPTEPAVA